MLTDVHKRAFSAFFVSHALILKRIEADLQEAGALPLELYDMLLLLELAPLQHLRVSDLGEAKVYSKSGLTRLVDRAEKDGLVTRGKCPKDKRAIWVQLTSLGKQKREETWVVFEKAIANYFASGISPEDAKELDRILRPIAKEKLKWQDCP